MITEYRYAIDYFSAEGRRLGSVAVEPDWDPARSWTQFLGVRQGRLPAVTGALRGHVEPIWDRAFGEPVVEAARVLVPTPDGVVTADIPANYFGDLADAGCRTLQGRLRTEVADDYRYRVCAYATVTSSGPDSDPDPGPRVEDVPTPLTLDERAIQEFCGEAFACGPGDHDDDVQVFVPGFVIQEAVARARRRPEVEVGGILLGRLHRDPNLGDLFLEVTAQLPVHTPEAHATKLEFTPETWSAVQAARDLRAQGEIMLGWYHSHPFFCRGCGDEERLRCRLARPFFSADDTHLHRTCFAQAFHVALLVSDQGDAGHCAGLFGWRRGMVVSRGFRLLAPAPAGRATSEGVQVDRRTS